MFGPDDLEWRGHFLYVRGLRSGKPLMSIEAAGGRQAGQWRIRYPDGRLSDLMDRAAARQEAEGIALVGLNAARVQATA